MGWECEFSLFSHSITVWEFPPTCRRNEGRSLLLPSTLTYKKSVNSLSIHLALPNQNPFPGEQTKEGNGSEKRADTTNGWERISYAYLSPGNNLQDSLVLPGAIGSYWMWFPTYSLRAGFCSRKAATTFGSKCFPDCSRMCSMIFSFDHALR